MSSSVSSAAKIVNINGVWHAEGRPRETVKLVAHHHPPNIPGKSLVVLLVEMPPNAATPGHTHSGAAVVGLSLEGTVLNKMNCDEPLTTTTRGYWYEAPGCHHVWSENLSKTENASFFAVLVVDDEVVKDGYDKLVVMDADKEAQGAD